MTVVQIKKTDHMDWIEWGINNDIDHSLLGWVKDNPHLMASFEDVKDPDENPYIFHPKQQRAAFVTPRSLEAASDILKSREHVDDITLTAALMGTIGDRGAMDLMAFVSLSDQLPSLQSIKDDPKSAKVPDSSAAAVCMVVYRTLSCVGERLARRLDGLLAASRHRGTGYVRERCTRTEVFQASDGHDQQEVHRSGLCRTTTCTQRIRSNAYILCNCGRAGLARRTC